jgi:hypothetical protein
MGETLKATNRLSGRGRGPVLQVSMDKLIVTKIDEAINLLKSAI